MLRVLPIVIGLALSIYAVIDCIQTDEEQVRNLPKVFWIILILLFTFVGPIAWFVAGRPTPLLPPGGRGGRGGRPGSPRGPRRPQGPDDDPDFLRGL